MQLAAWQPKWPNSSRILGFYFKPAYKEKERLSLRETHDTSGRENVTDTLLIACGTDGCLWDYITKTASYVNTIVMTSGGSWKFET